MGLLKWSCLLLSAGRVLSSSPENTPICASLQSSGPLLAFQSSPLRFESSWLVSHCSGRLGCVVRAGSCHTLRPHATSPHYQGSLSIAQNFLDGENISQYQWQTSQCQFPASTSTIVAQSLFLDNVRAPCDAFPASRHFYLLSSSKYSLDLTFGNCVGATPERSEISIQALAVKYELPSQGRSGSFSCLLWQRVRLQNEALEHVYKPSSLPLSPGQHPHQHPHHHIL